MILEDDLINIVKLAELHEYKTVLVMDVRILSEF